MGATLALFSLLPLQWGGLLYTLACGDWLGSVLFSIALGANLRELRRRYRRGEPA